MWFRLAMFPNSTQDLGAIIATDGKIYWRLTDIGRFLGYKSPFNFARNYKNISGDERRFKISDLVPLAFHCTHSNGKAVTFQEMLHLMTRKKFRFDIKAFTDVWVNGHILLPEKMYVAHNYGESLRLVVVQDKDEQRPTIPLQEFISQFTNFVMEYYDSLSKVGNFFYMPTELNAERSKTTNEIIDKQQSETNNGNINEQQSDMNNGNINGNNVEPTILQQSETNNGNTDGNDERILQQSETNDGLLENLQSTSEEESIDRSETITSSTTSEEETMDPDNIYMSFDGLHKLPKSIYLMWKGYTYGYDWNENKRRKLS